MTDLISSDSLLFRNVRPDEFDNGRIYSCVFNPSEEHEFKLSVDRGSLLAPVQSFERHVSSGLSSIGVCGVRAAAFTTEAISCSPDPIPNNHAHAVADFSPFGTNARKKKARKLAEIASARGFDFIPKT